MAKKKGLGRGLGALMDDLDQDLDHERLSLDAPIEAIAPNPSQPRAGIKTKGLKTLIESIRDKGVLEPLVVRRSLPGQYELIAGERRLLAAKEAGLKTVPVIIRDATPSEMLELALVENLLREDLNPMEEAEAYQRLAGDFRRSQDDIARMSGRDRSTVANLLRLLQLPGPVQEDVRQDRLTVGHARALLALEDPDLILTAREQVLARRLSVRQTEILVKKTLAPPPRKKTSDKDDVYFQALADQMTRGLGAKVKVARRGRRGRIEISFSSYKELERLMDLLGFGPV